MGVLGEFFEFDGRLDRLGYFWRCMAVVAVLWALAAFGRGALAFMLGSAGLFGVRTWAEWATVAVLMLAAWTGLALSSRRLRDMGLEPAWVVPIYGFLCSAGVGFGAPVIRLAPPPFDSLAALALMLPGLPAAPLLIWPSGIGRRTIVIGYVEPKLPTAYVDWRHPEEAES